MMKRTLTRVGAVMIGAGAIALALSNGELARVSITAMACGFLLMVLDANLARYDN
jgi:hypothetical protein